MLHITNEKEGSKGKRANPRTQDKNTTLCLCGKNKREGKNNRTRDRASVGLFVVLPWRGPLGVSHNSSLLFFWVERQLVNGASQPATAIARLPVNVCFRKTILYITQHLRGDITDFSCVLVMYVLLIKQEMNVAVKQVQEKNANTTTRVIEGLFRFALQVY